MEKQKSSVFITGEKIEAIPLKIVNKFEDITKVMTVMDIIPTPIADSVFLLDEKRIRRKY